MRGTRIASSIGSQRATAITRPLGGNVHLLQPRWHMAMTVGISGTTYGYFSGNFGSLEPDRWGGQVITQINVSDSDFVEVESSNDPLVNVDPLLVTLSGWGSFVLPWNAGFDSYADIVNGLGAWMAARVGQVVGVRFARVS